MTLHIHAPQPDNALVRLAECPTCARRSRFVETHVPWYGWTATCLRCGDTWEDGERMERPFAPGWRQKAIEAARDRYRRARAAINAGPKEATS